MVRVKRGTTANKRRKNVLKHTKGFRWGRKSKYKAAKEALLHAWTYSYRDRRTKKRDFRQLWQTKINSQSRKLDLSYSRFINALKQNKIELDRKILADLAENNPEVFTKIVEYCKNTKPEKKEIPKEIKKEK
tara:strand:+ start:21 stop:416 length:396 start_codon:yes stop_codon:yes gene_type:complete